jgi:hypothetical protein
MLVKATFKNEDAFTADEIKESFKSFFGNPADVEVYPDSQNPKDYIYYGIQQLITPAQLDLLLDEEPHLYREKVTELKRGVLANLERIINNVIVDNEVKLYESKE